MLRVIALHKSAERGIEAEPADVVVNGSAQLAPALDRPFHLELLDALDRAVERHPGHDLGIGEALAIAAHFPNAVVRLLPDMFQMIEQRALQLPALGAGAEIAKSAMMDRVHDLAEHVNLHVFGCGIAGAYRLGAP